MGRIWKYLKETPTWVWLALFLVAAMITTSALRQNNLQMVKLRDTLYIADQKGEGVDQALNNLRGWVYAHMNTDLTSGNAIKPPVQLKSSYDRLVKAEQQRIDEANNKIYRQAQAYCAARSPGPFRQVCFKQYVDKYNVKADSIPPALYQFDFASPVWSPDLAGWSLIASIILGAITIVSFLADRLAFSRYKRVRRKATKA